MIRVFLLLLAVMSGTWYLADAIKQKGPGYVYIYYNQYSIETSFWFFLLLLIGAVVGIFILTKGISLFFYYLVKIGYLPKYFWMTRAKKLRYEGSLAFLNQQWRVSGKKLARAAKNSETPFLDYLMAARANLAAQDIDAAKKNADLAIKAKDFDAGSHELLKMDIAIAEGDVQGQEQTIKKLLDQDGKRPAVLSRAIRVYREQKKWQSLQALLPAIKKYKVLAPADYNDLLAAIAVGMMPALNNITQRQDLKNLWKSVAKVQDRADVLQAYCEALIRMHEGKEAQKILETHLKQQWSDVLIGVYAALPATDALKQMEFAESFLPYHGHNPALLVALGQIAKHNGYVGKAKDYLYRAMQITPTVKAWELLADIAQSQQDFTQAQGYLRQALALATQA